jgi:hypothetical protein
VNRLGHADRPKPTFNEKPVIWIILNDQDSGMILLHKQNASEDSGFRQASSWQEDNRERRVRICGGSTVGAPGRKETCNHLRGIQPNQPTLFISNPQTQGQPQRAQKKMSTS